MTVIERIYNARDQRRMRANMQARGMVDAASYGPDTLKAIGQAFDEAWASIAGNFGDDPADVERARLKLANALLSVASEDSRDVEALKKGALQPWHWPTVEGKAIAAPNLEPLNRRCKEGATRLDHAPLSPATAG